MGRALDIEALFRQQVPSDPRWSPDGRWVAFVLGFTDAEQDAAGSALWLLSADGREVRPLTRGRKADGAPAADSHPRWSPDGARVAFLSNRGGETQVWLIPAFGGEAEPVTGGETGCGPVMTDPFFAGLEWSPDGSRLAFAAQLPAPPGCEELGPVVAGIDYGETYGHVQSRIQVWSVAPGGGAAQKLTDGDFDCGDPRWSPDGRWLAFTSNRSGDEGPVSASINKNYDLWLVPAEGGEARRLTENPGPDYSPRWSPDGRRLAYLAGCRCGPHRDCHQLCVLDVASGAVRELTREEGPLPDVPACWSPDGEALLFSAWSGVESHLFRVPLEGGRPECLAAGRALLSGPALSPDGRTLACVAQGPASLPELQLRPLARDGASSVAAATSFNSWLEEYDLGGVEVVSWESDGWRIEGVLVKPPGYEAGRRYPALVFSHGGPHSRVTCGLHLEWFWQLLAARGYVVLAPNFRGSAGYGRAFLDADREDWGGGDFRDLMRGVDLLVERGLADPERLGIFGGSYGGYMTTWSAGNTDRFKAAVARAPITDLVSYYGTTDLKTLTGWDMGGAPWEKPGLYAERSPVTRIPRVNTPVLLLHGDADRRVPITQSEEFYTGLKTMGVPVTLVRYPGEGHMIARPRHVRDCWERTIEWFDRYL